MSIGCLFCKRCERGKDIASVRRQRLIQPPLALAEQYGERLGNIRKLANITLKLLRETPDGQQFVNEAELPFPRDVMGTRRPALRAIVNL